MSMIGYKMLYLDLRSIWYHYPYQRDTIHREMGLPVVAEHGFHFYENIEDVPDMDKYFESGAYVLVKVEALGDIVSKPQAQPPDYTSRMLYATNAIKIIKIISRNAVMEMIDYFFDELIGKRNFAVADYKQENKEYLEFEYSRLYDMFYHASEEYAWDEESKARKAIQPGIFYLDASHKVKGPDKGDYVLFVGHPNDITDKQKEETVVITGIPINKDEPEPVPPGPEPPDPPIPPGPEPTLVDGPLKIVKTDGTEIKASEDGLYYQYDIDVASIYYVSMNEEWNGTYESVSIHANVGETILRITDVAVSNIASDEDREFIVIGEDVVSTVTIQVNTRLDIVTNTSTISSFSDSPIKIIGEGRISIVQNDSTNTFREPSIYTSCPVTISLAGGVNINNKAVGQSCIEVHSLTVSSNTNITLTSANYGIEVIDSLILNRGGTINVVETKNHSIFTPFGTVRIDGGTINIVKTYGCGIRAQHMIMNDGEVTILTAFVNAATDFYDRHRGVGNFNVYQELENGYQESIFVNNGEHHGIHIGTEGCTYTIGDSENRTEKAVGTFVMNAGVITIDTATTGLIYNDNKDHRVIGAPGHGIVVETNATISGGTLQFITSGNAIVAKKALTLKNTSKIIVDRCYNGIITSTFMSGAAGSSYGPELKITALSDVIQLISENVVIHYVSEERVQYSKIVTWNDSVNSNYTTYSGSYKYNTVDGRIRIYLNNRTGSEQFDVTSYGCGIYCYGTLYFYGGSHMIYTNWKDDTDPLYMTEQYIVGNDAEITLCGADSHEIRPTTARIPYVQYGEELNIVNRTIGILDMANGVNIKEFKLEQTAMYEFFSNKDLVFGQRYALTSNGNVRASVAARK